VEEEIEIIDYNDMIKNLQDENDPPVLKTTLKALSFFSGLFLFLIALFVLIFPYPTMIMYSNLNMHTGAYNSAARVVNMRFDEDADWDSRFADGLYMAVDMSNIMLLNEIDRRGHDHRRVTVWAENNYKHTSLMLDEFEVLMRTRNIRLDPETWAAVPVRAARPAVYSFENAVRVQRMRSKYFVDYQENLNDIIANFASEFDRFGQLIELPNPISVSELDRVIMYINELNAIIRLELAMLGFDFAHTAPLNQYIENSGIRDRLDGQFRLLFNAAGDATNALRELQENIVCQDEDTMFNLARIIHDFSVTDDPNLQPHQREARYLQRAWWAMSLSSLTNNIRIADLIVNGAADNWQRFDNTKVEVAVGGGFELREFGLSAWYNRGLPVTDIVGYVPGNGFPLYDFVTFKLQ